MELRWTAPQTVSALPSMWLHVPTSLYEGPIYKRQSFLCGSRT